MTNINATHYRVEVDERFVGDVFLDDSEAHDWVAREHPGKPYVIHAIPRVGAGRIDRFLPRDAAR